MVRLDRRLGNLPGPCFLLSHLPLEELHVLGMPMILDGANDSQRHGYRDGRAPEQRCLDSVPP